MQPANRKREPKFSKRFRDRCSRLFGNGTINSNKEHLEVMSFFHNRYSRLSDTTNSRLNVSENGSDTGEEGTDFEPQARPNTPISSSSKEIKTQRYSFKAINEPEDIYSYVLVGPTFTVIDLPCNNSDIVNFDSFKKVRGIQKTTSRI